ncbi:hypothetical protein OV090_07200 [Nannocystis sp. RBIL2]|uniref:hypothetical protein n=1 Tax=Nannocystis sp. RBIL2 TaxID=2996788 RepID=UPI00226F7E55|nr:hypothetical protein [Nannocystis sp. RBIL2]MCY1064541.1 hypothetical protein [Nannocystis sp. RBIL2]
MPIVAARKPPPRPASVQPATTLPFPRGAEVDGAKPGPSVFAGATELAARLARDDEIDAELAGDGELATGDELAEPTRINDS